MKVGVKRFSSLEPVLPLPQYMTEGASGMDLYADIEETIQVEPLQRVLISTGLALAIPDGYEGQVRPRSGWAIKMGMGILNSPGTIDSDYRGEVKVGLINFGENPVTIKRGDRIAQLIFIKVEQACLVEFDELNRTGRGIGGFGHTGR